MSRDLFLALIVAIVILCLCVCVRVKPNSDSEAEAGSFKLKPNNEHKNIKTLNQGVFSEPPDRRDLWNDDE